MKILHQNGFSAEERQKQRDIILRNVLSSMHTLCEKAIEFNEQLDPALQQHANTITALTSLQADPQYVTPITALWESEPIQKTFARRGEYVLLDNTPYYMSNISRILVPGYEPTDNDILRSRVATSGIIETDFILDRQHYKMYDVGGQRGERKKWIHCFDHVHAIFFIASLNDYDQTLAEDKTRNRLLESVCLFEGIISLPWFKNTSIILFLNKNDLFTEKIKSVDLGLYFPTYVGGCDYEDALDYIKEMFFSKNLLPSKTVYAHVTDATDTHQIAFVWQCTKDIIITQNLINSGLLR